MSNPQNTLVIECQPIGKQPTEDSIVMRGVKINQLSKEVRNFNKVMKSAKGCIVAIQRHTQKGLELIVYNNGRFKSIIKPNRTNKVLLRVSTTEKWWFIGTSKNLGAIDTLFAVAPLASRVKPYITDHLDTEVATAVSIITNTPVMNMR